MKFSSPLSLCAPLAVATAPAAAATLCGTALPSGLKSHSDATLESRGPGFCHRPATAVPSAVCTVTLAENS